MTTEYTDHFRLNLPDFRMGPWHDLVNEDFITIDALLMSLYQGVDTQNWDNNVHYLPGTTAIDPADNTFWVCIVDHTSAPSGTFSADRAAHPTYWNRVVVGIAPRGEWQNSTHYLPNDMVSDSIEHVIAVAKDEHTSNATGTIRDDGAHWTFIADIGSAAAVAASVSYDNTTSGSAYTQLQGTTDDLYASAASQQATLADHSTRIGGLETTVGVHASEISTNASAISANASAIATNSGNITALQSSDTSQNSRLTALESHPSGITDAPSDGTTYARKNAAWIDVLSVAGASVLVSDTPPSSPRDGQLWWESDTGNLYIYYNDGNTTQWVIAVPQLDGGSFVAKSGDTMTGPLTLAADPTAPMHAATKQYVDAQFSLLPSNVGKVEYWTTTVVPTGRLKANGGSYLRSTYPILFAYLVRQGTATFTNGSSNVGMAAHNLSVGDPVKLFTTGALPTNFTAGTHGLPTVGTNYFIKTVVDANTVQLATTVAGAAISAGSAGSGTHTWVNAPHGDGDGSTTFTVPDLRGYFVRCWNDNAAIDASRAFADIQSDAFQGHLHGGVADSIDSTNAYFSNGTGVSLGLRYTGNTGNPVTSGTFGTPRTANETRPKNVSLMATVRYSA